MSKRNKEFKKRLMENRITSDKKRNEFLEKKVVKFEFNDIVASIDRGKFFVSKEEIKEIVEDLLYIKAPIKSNTIIELDNYCDVCYKLFCVSADNKEMIFNLC